MSELSAEDLPEIKNYLRTAILKLSEAHIYIGYSGSDACEEENCRMCEGIEESFGLLGMLETFPFSKPAVEINL